jgi:glycosyltransferase involved in cell wall biosynthesis
LNLLLQIQKEFEPILITYQTKYAEDLQVWAHDHQVRLVWVPDTPWKKHRFPYISRWIINRPGGLVNFDRQKIAERVQEVNLKEGEFSLVYFATQLTGQAIPLLHPSMRTVLDLHDVYSPMARQKALSVSPFRPHGVLFRLEAHRMAFEERQLIQKATHTLVVSKDDLYTVQRMAPGKPAALIPNGTELPANIDRSTGSQIVLLVASFYYAPNQEGLRWFVKKVWPAVLLAKPEARFIVVGQGSEAFQLELSTEERVEFAGRVPDIISYYRQARCAVAPILEGGGSRLKVLEAMAQYVPLVSTSKGAEGIDYDDSLWIADQPEEFAKAVIRCLSDSTEVADKVQQARRIIETQYSWDVIGSQLRAILHEVAA